MARRMILMLVVVTVVVAVIGSIKVHQIQTAIAEAAAFQPPPVAVTTTLAREARWPSALAAIGTVTAVHGVTVSADLPGIVETISFESGKAVRRGDVLVALDTSQERAQLAAAAAALELTRLNLERMRELRGKGVTSQAELDRFAAENEQAQARSGEIRAAIERKTIRAPFDWILGIRQVNLGQYLRSGDPVVPLQSLNPIYVDFAVPQQEVGKLHRGAEVRATAEGVAGDGFAGTVTAVDSVVDPATRNIQVQATFANPEGILHPGMFVETRVRLGDGTTVVALPASAISYAPYGDSVFIVEQVKGKDDKAYLGVRQQFVRLGGARGDQVAVLSGVKDGEQVVSSGAFKLRNGAAVLVNNEIQPANDPAPKLEDS
jgi:membrane fusion protein, multidrug efflux system